MIRRVQLFAKSSAVNSAMFIKQYLYRLPVDYDMARIRDRIAARAPLWNDVPGLVFKAFATQECGHHGAGANCYASIYLWRHEEAALNFVFSERFQNVVDTFGRPDVETWMAVDARSGPSQHPAFLCREDYDVSRGSSLAAFRDAERKRNIVTAAAPQTFAAMVGLNLDQWRLARFVLASEPLPVNERGLAFEIAYLAQPRVCQLGDRDERDQTCR